ncbi:MAG: hypothetical protein R3C70_15405 [Geminicoccaceae bacterium]
MRLFDKGLAQAILARNATQRLPLRRRQLASKPRTIRLSSPGALRAIRREWYEEVATRA